MLGPQCNHDLGILLRLCDFAGYGGDDATDGGAASESRSASEHCAAGLSAEQWSKTRAALVEAIGDHEWYCSSYSSKEQPHSEGLLLTLVYSLRKTEEEMAAALAQGESVSAQEHARQSWVSI